MTQTPSTVPALQILGKGQKLRALGSACLAHILHDGYTDLLYLLFPIWQREFGFSFALIGVMKTLFSGALSLFQILAAKLAGRLGQPAVLAIGTFLVASAVLCYGAASSPGVLFALLLAGGIGAAAQHPLSSSIVANAFGSSRMALGTYNFAGDAGKVLLPSAAAFIIWLSDWRTATSILGLARIVFSVVLFWLIPPSPASPSVEPAKSGAPTKKEGLKPGFASLTAIGVLDNATRTGFLTFLPLLLSQNGAGPTLIGTALSLIFIGGAAGKFACGALAERAGIIRTVIVTEALTAFLIAALLISPLTLLVFFLLPLGIALNGTSSVLYGSIAELAPQARRADAFAWFYTASLGAGAIAPPLFGLIGDAAGLTLSIACVAFLALAALPLAMRFGSERSKETGPDEL
jgi:MFS transporter, FSR family, fosmidomycin resistance protein